MIFFLGRLNFNIPTALNRPSTLSGSFQFLDEEMLTVESLKGNNYRGQDMVAIKESFKVVIGTVVCHEPNDFSSREEALVLLKSTILSAVIYETFPINIEFHLFLDQKVDEEYFLNNIEPFSVLLHEVQVDLYFYSVFDIVPKEYKNMLYEYETGLKCSYLRIFLPDVLSKVDSILYLDTDVIITGNLGEIWDKFYKMEKFQQIGAVMDIEPDNEPYFEVNLDFFLNTPIPTPRGLNAGVLFMNLTKMREYKFVDKFFEFVQALQHN